MQTTSLFIYHKLLSPINSNFYFTRESAYQITITIPKNSNSNRIEVCLD
jgi:hypothetical protein